MLDHEITALPWTSAPNFAQDFKNNLERIKSTCCFLTLCVMAHGSPGTVRGDDGSILEVNQILKLVNDSFPYRTPAVPVVSQTHLCNCLFAPLLRILVGIGIRMRFAGNAVFCTCIFTCTYIPTRRMIFSTHKMA